MAEDKEICVLAVDPSTSTGIAVFYINNDRISLVFSGVIKGSRDVLGRKFVQIVKTLNPDEMYIEDYFASGGAVNGMCLNMEIRGMFKWIFNCITGRDAVEMNIGHWKKLATGDGKADKDDVIAALEERLIRCDYSFIDGKYKNFCNDESDAIGIGIAATIERGTTLVDEREHREKTSRKRR